MPRFLLLVLPALLGLPVAAQDARLPQSPPGAAPARQAPADPAKQLADLRKLAASGDKNAPFQLGVYYLIGQGVPQDAAQAEQYFHQAELTPARDCFVGETYMETALPGRVDAAMRWVNAANSGCTWWELANWYGTNRLGPDPAKEVEFIRKGLAAKDDGYHRALRARLGELLLTGAPVAGSPTEHLAWIGEAARQRLGLAEWMIATDISQHPDDSDLPSAALEWMRHSARYGIPEALTAVGQAAIHREISELSFMDGVALYELGVQQTLSAFSEETQRKQLQPEQREELDDYEARWGGVVEETGGFYTKRDPLHFAPPLDIEALVKLAVPGDPDAQLRLAYAYQAEGDLDKANALYRDVAAEGPARLWSSLAQRAAQSGKWSRAVELYQRSAYNGSREACAELARIAAEGLAGKPDPAAAYLWLLISESKDNPLLAERKKALSDEQLKSVALAHAQWLIDHQDHWKGDIGAAQKLIADDRQQANAARGRIDARPRTELLQELRRKALSGDKESSFAYALELLRGGDIVDVAVIERYALRGPADAAHQADIAAAYERASFLDDSARRKYAIRWWTDVGGSRGYYQLAEMYYGHSDGTVATDDEKQAVEYWEKSVAAGDERWARLSRMKLGYCVVKGWSSGNRTSDAAWAHELAMEMLGKEYYQVAGEYSYGRELQHNPATYLHLVERAAVYNIDNAQGVLAHEILQGNWKPRDELAAYSWLKRQTVKEDVGGRQEVQTAEQNSGLRRNIEVRYAQLLLTREECGAFYPQDDPLRTAGLAELEPRASAEDPEADFRLAALLENRGGDRDLTRAISLYHDLWARAGQQVRLAWGRTLMYGTAAVPRDDIGAEKWLWDAANSGSKEACRLLAVIYAEGRGFKADPVAAEAWRELAGDTATSASFSDEEKFAVTTRLSDWKQKHPNW